MAKSYFLLSNNVPFETDYPEYQRDAKRISKAEYQKLKHEHDKAELLQMIKPGDSIWCNVVSVSRSGMSRTIKLYIVEGARIRNISGYVATLTGNQWVKDGGVKVNGCGMDMCFHLVYELGCALWPNGTPEPHSNRNGQPDTAGGYALEPEHM